MALSDSVPHLSVVELLKEALPGEVASDIIRRKARAIINKHRGLWKGPPFCPAALADMEGIIVEKAPCPIPSHGRIFPINKQVYIQYADGLTEERVRFTICHELAHTLFDDCYKRERRRSKADDGEREFEDLCNIAAAEFLFPIPEFSRDSGAGQITAQRLKDLAALYIASIDATARRFVHLCATPACVLFAQYKKPTGKSVVSLFGQYAVANSTFPHRLFRGFKINSKSVANHAFSSKEPAGARESWMIRGNWSRLRVEAVPLPKFDLNETADLAILLYPS